MKRIALIAAALSTLAPAAFAYAPNELTKSETSEVLQYVPTADLSNLTSAQVLAISNALTSDDSGVGRTIYSILNW